MYGNYKSHQGSGQDINTLLDQQMRDLERDKQMLGANNGFPSRQAPPIGSGATITSTSGSSYKPPGYNPQPSGESARERRLRMRQEARMQNPGPSAGIPPSGPIGLSTQPRNIPQPGTSSQPSYSNPPPSYGNPQPSYGSQPPSQPNYGSQQNQPPAHMRKRAQSPLDRNRNLDNRYGNEFGPSEPVANKRTSPGKLTAAQYRAELDAQIRAKKQRKFSTDGGYIPIGEDRKPKGLPQQIHKQNQPPAHLTNRYRRELDQQIKLKRVKRGSVVASNIDEALLFKRDSARRRKEQAYFEQGSAFFDNLGNDRVVRENRTGVIPEKKQHDLGPANQYEREPYQPKRYQMPPPSNRAPQNGYSSGPGPSSMQPDRSYPGPSSMGPGPSSMQPDRSYPGPSSMGPGPSSMQPDRSYPGPSSMGPGPSSMQPPDRMQPGLSGQPSNIPPAYDSRPHQPPSGYGEYGATPNKPSQPAPSGYTPSVKVLGGAKGSQSPADYRRELEKQIQDKKRREAEKKRQEEEWERQKEEEMNSYNPFGKPGSGAPVRQPGLYLPKNNSPEKSGFNPSFTPSGDPPVSSGYDPQPAAHPLEGPSYGAPDSSPVKRSYGGGPTSFSLGGGAMQPEKPATDEAYKNDLMRQIQEKKRKKAEKEAREKEEERLEMERLRKEQEEMDRKFKEEKAREMEDKKMAIGQAMQEATAARARKKKKREAEAAMDVPITIAEPKRKPPAVHSVEEPIAVKHNVSNRPSGGFNPTMEESPVPALRMGAPSNRLNNGMNPTSSGVGSNGPGNNGYNPGNNDPGNNGYNPGRNGPGNNGYNPGNNDPSNNGYNPGRNGPGNNDPSNNGYNPGRNGPGNNGYNPGNNDLNSASRNRSFGQPMSMGSARQRDPIMSEIDPKLMALQKQNDLLQDKLAKIETQNEKLALSMEEQRAEVQRKLLHERKRQELEKLDLEASSPYKRGYASSTASMDDKRKRNYDRTMDVAKKLGIDPFQEQNLDISLPGVSQYEFFDEDDQKKGATSTDIFSNVIDETEMQRADGELGGESDFRPVTGYQPKKKTTGVANGTQISEKVSHSTQVTSRVKKESTPLVKPLMLPKLTSRGTIMTPHGEEEVMPLHTVRRKNKDGTLTSITEDQLELADTYVDLEGKPLQPRFVENETGMKKIVIVRTTTKKTVQPSEESPVNATKNHSNYGESLEHVRRTKNTTLYHDDLFNDGNSMTTEDIERSIERRRDFIMRTGHRPESASSVSSTDSLSSTSTFDIDNVLARNKLRYAELNDDDDLSATDLLNNLLKTSHNEDDETGGSPLRITDKAGTTTVLTAEDLL
ncbi:hypothetical protein PCE1_004693 [Barthelona sp. PCE]